MAKLMVMIDMPDMTYEELAKIVRNPDEHKDWYDGKSKNGLNLISIDGALLKRASNDDSHFAFEVIGCRP